MRKENKTPENKKRYFLTYTAVFSFCAFLMCLWLFLHGKTNINQISDGMNQHYRALIFYSRYLKGIFSDLFSTGKLNIPLWNLSIGEGSDIIDTLHGYGFGDPITFFCVFVPERYLYIFYLFSALARMYLSGLFFSMLAFYKGIRNHYAVLGGAICYAFCFWALQNFSLHIYFLTPLMYLPLLILSLEWIIDGRSPILFIIVVFLSSISWFYFFYMEALATALYGILRVLTLYRKDLLKGIRLLFVILGYALIGVLMGAAILAPVVLAYTGDTRTAIIRIIPVLYPAFFYERLFTIFVANDFPYDLYGGFASACLLSLGLLLKNYKKHGLLLAILVLCFLSVCLPYAGLAWNGFSYVSERWSFVLALPIAYTLSVMWDEFEGNRRYLAIVQVVLLLMSFYSAWSRSEWVFVPMGICILFNLIAASGLKKTIGIFDLRQCAMIVLILINVLYIYEFNLSGRGDGVMDDLLSIETARNINNVQEAALMKEYYEDQSEIFRYDSNHYTNNAAMTAKVYSTNYYFSITNPDDQYFRKELGIRDVFSCRMQGYDFRSVLDTLANVRYYMHNPGYGEVLPYGFRYLETKGKFDIYINENELPFGYTYDKTISYEDWYGMDALQKQETLLDHIVVKDGEHSSFKPDNIKEISYDVLPGDGVIYENGKVTAGESGQSIVLSLKEEVKDEAYIIINGLEHSDDFNLIEDDRTVAQICLQPDNNDAAYIIHMPLQHRYNYNKHDYVTYLGNKDGLEQITISFDLPGTYTIGEIKVFDASMDDYSKKISALGEDHLEDVKLSTNRIEGNISLGKEKCLLVSILYSKGWKAYIDGQETEVLKANEHHVGLLVPEGDHTITFTYFTPGLKIGLLASLCGFVLFVSVIILDKKRRARS